MLGLGRLIEFLSLVLVVKGATFSHNSLLVCNFGVLVYRSSCYYSRGWNNTICRLLPFFFSRFNLVNEALMSITFFKRKYTFCCKREKISHSTFGKNARKSTTKAKKSYSSKKILSENELSAAGENWVREGSLFHAQFQRSTNATLKLSNREYW